MNEVLAPRRSRLGRDAAQLLGDEHTAAPVRREPVYRSPDFNLRDREQRHTNVLVTGATVFLPCRCTWMMCASPRARRSECRARRRRMFRGARTSRATEEPELQPSHEHSAPRTAGIDHRGTCVCRHTFAPGRSPRASSSSTQAGSWARLWRRSTPPMGISCRTRRSTCEACSTRSTGNRGLRVASFAAVCVR